MQPCPNYEAICQRISEIADKLLNRLSQPDVLKHYLKEAQDKNIEECIRSEAKIEDSGNGGGDKGRRYRSYSVKFKKMIVDMIKREQAEGKGSLYSIMKRMGEEYGIHVKNLRRWYGLKEIKRREGGRRAAFPEIEEKLAVYMKDNPDCKRKTLRELAQKYLQELNPPTNR